MDVTTPKALYAQPDILTRGKFSKSHLYNLMARGQFPQPALRCGPRFTRWSAADVDEWLSNPQGWITAHAESAVTA
jgi:predicted DNA-binding transcriptional regulator AlpA